MWKFHSMTSVYGALVFTAFVSHGCGNSGSPPSPSCDPALNQGPVADGGGVFVASSGGGSGSGTQASPFKDLQSALDAAATLGATGRVYVCAASFDGEVRVPAGITLYGGLACDASWASGAGKTTITADAGHVPLRLASGSAATVLFDIAVVARSGSAPGGSSIAMLVNGVVATLERCDLSAGDGVPGSDGANGGLQNPPSASGSDGAVACGNQALHKRPNLT